MPPVAPATTTLSDVKAMKLYRVFCTCVELCEDRGYSHFSKPSVLAPAASQRAKRTAELNNSIPDEPLVTYQTFLQSFSAPPSTANDGGAAPSPSPTTLTLSNGLTLQRDRMTLVMSRPKAPKATEATLGGSTPVKAEDSDEDEEQREDSKKKSKKQSDGPKNRLMVVFHGEETLSMQHVTAYRSKAIKKSAESLVIVTPTRLFANVRRDISELSSHLDDITGLPIMSIQVFEEDELVVNPTRHETVPKHTVLSQEALAAMLKEYGTTVPQLPRMLLKDPIAQYYGLQRGQVVRIDRNSEASGPYVMYRQVI